ncbi:hypothetical protein SRABI118_04822 [Massilia sp. Bi118]|uniref:hypothetical protein n=1 Tax=Massilia sp. Bi118 TaxID=2822346 RepID=UPI001DECFD4F|nr:hypothetical protein [Massilia sp. Bi118]CAH0311783.1 hypothetical protein SRABI118_04822 [Massilia sp. Bi118]
MRAMNNHDDAQNQGALAKSLGRVLLGTGAILMIPLVAMRFTREVNWDVFDFLVAGVLLAGIGSLYVLLTRKLRTATQRRAIGGGLLLTLLLTWAELAVGIFGSPIAGS